MPLGGRWNKGGSRVARTLLRRTVILLVCKLSGVNAPAQARRKRHLRTATLVSSVPLLLTITPGMARSRVVMSVLGNSLFHAIRR